MRNSAVCLPWVMQASDPHSKLKKNHYPKAKQANDKKIPTRPPFKQPATLILYMGRQARLINTTKLTVSSVRGKLPPGHMAHPCLMRAAANRLITFLHLKSGCSGLPLLLLSLGSWASRSSWSIHAGKILDVHSSWGMHTSSLGSFWGAQSWECPLSSIP